MPFRDPIPPFIDFFSPFCCDSWLHRILMLWQTDTAHFPVPHRPLYQEGKSTEGLSPRLGFWITRICPEACFQATPGLTDFLGLCSNLTLLISSAPLGEVLVPPRLILSEIVITACRGCSDKRGLRMPLLASCLLLPSWSSPIFLLFSPTVTSADKSNWTVFNSVL